MNVSLYFLANRSSSGRFAVVPSSFKTSQMICAFTRKSETDQSAGILDHEIDRFRCDERRGANQVALVLPVFVVGDENHLPRPDVRNRLLYRAKSSLRFLFHCSLSEIRR